MPDCDFTEDHERYAGKVVTDPWDDPEQTDWPNMTIEEVLSSGVGADQGVDQFPESGE